METAAADLILDPLATTTIALHRQSIEAFTSHGEFQLTGEDLLKHLDESQSTETTHPSRQELYSAKNDTLRARAQIKSKHALLS